MPRSRKSGKDRQELTVRGTGQIDSGYSAYSEEIAQNILLRLAKGENICAICEHKDYPSRMTVFRWRLQYPAFREKYDMAMSARDEFLVEECLHLADSAGSDTDIKKLKLQLQERHYALEHNEKANRKLEQRGNPEDAKTIEATVLESTPLSEAIAAYRAGRSK